MTKEIIEKVPKNFKGDKRDLKWWTKQKIGTYHKIDNKNYAYFTPFVVSRYGMSVRYPKDGTKWKIVSKFIERYKDIDIPVIVIRKELKVLNVIRRGKIGGRTC